MPSSGVQKCARSEEHTSELQSHSHLLFRLLLEKKLPIRSEEHTSELKSHSHLVCRLLLGKNRARHPAAACRHDRPGPAARLVAAALNPGAPASATGQYFFFKDRQSPESYPLARPDGLPH